ncbi:MAG: ATP synthase F1 subunit epsilon [Gemmataceae bacterium]|nr:ATP synthase F1 subunit epsilon [Gemmata sp.]MDW8198984.1 ATP synthase F1 subunit epsilon [Gemmataceae bacterium]
MSSEPTLQSAVERMMPSEATELADSRKGRVRVIVVTPERAVLDDTAELVILPMIDGELGVLPGRAPLIGRLGAGELRLMKSGRATQRLFVEAGFVQVRSNVVTVLTSKTEEAAAITAAMAAAAEAEAEALPASNARERATKEKARDRARGLKKVAAKNTVA